MHKLLLLFLAFVFAALNPTPSLAAEFYTGENLHFEQKDSQPPLDNAYIAGQKITIDTEANNDLVVAGQTINIDGQVEGNLIAAGNEINVNQPIGRNARIAGNIITINSRIEQDLVVFGAELIVTEDARINGDIVFNGSSLVVDGEVSGTVNLNATQAQINNTIGNLNAWHVSQLTLGNNAEIANDLTYLSPRQATLERGAVIHGDIDYQESDSRQLTSKFTNSLFFYSILASMIFCLTLLLLLRKAVEYSIHRVEQNVLLSLGIGIAGVIALPFLAFVAMLVSVWLGIAMLLSYFLLVVVCIGLSQILIGSASLKWWFGRTKQPYPLDWRAAIIGVLLSTLLIYVPFLGWFILFLALLLTFGGAVQGVGRLR